ncbi:MAG: TolC family protein [Desulfurobacteriaceae bacterium]
MRKTLLVFLILTKASFGLTIDELKKLIDEKSLDIASGKEAVKKAEISKEATFREYFPRISLNAEFDKIYPYTTFPKETWNEQYILGVSVSSNLLNFQRNIKLKMDKVQISLTKENIKTSRLNLYFEGISKLLKLKALEKTIKIRKDLLKSSREILAISQEKYKQGLALITDVLKAKANLENAKNSLQKAKKEYVKTFNGLNELVDFVLREDEKPEVELLERLNLPKVDILVQEALKKRPEILSLKKEIEISKLNVELQKKTLSPQLTVSASYSKMDTKFFPENDNFNFSVSLNFPIFDSGETKLKTLASQKDLKIKLISLKKQENAIRREVLNAFEEVRSAIVEAESAKAFLCFSKKAYDRTFAEYKAGVSDITTLLQTFQNLKEAEENYISALLNLNISYYSLKKATGELIGGKE